MPGLASELVSASNILNRTMQISCNMQSNWKCFEPRSFHAIRMVRGGTAAGPRSTAAIVPGTAGRGPVGGRDPRTQMTGCGTGGRAARAPQMAAPGTGPATFALPAGHRQVPSLPPFGLTLILTLTLTLIF